MAYFLLPLLVYLSDEPPFTNLSFLMDLAFAAIFSLFVGCSKELSSLRLSALSYCCIACYSIMLILIFAAISNIRGQMEA